MAAQDVRLLVPRVRRALEGPVPLPSGALSDDQVVAVTADAIADVILLTAGAWNHTLEVTDTDVDTGFPDEWAISPELSLQEESVIAAQAAITYFFHRFRSEKISERIAQEGREWEWQKSANVLRDWIKLLQDQRDAALTALMRVHPALARYASILAVRDRAGAAMLEPWTVNGLGGGQELAPNTWFPAP